MSQLAEVLRTLAYDKRDIDLVIIATWQQGVVSNHPAARCCQPNGSLFLKLRLKELHALSSPKLQLRKQVVVALLNSHSQEV